MNYPRRFAASIVAFAISGTAGLLDAPVALSQSETSGDVQVSPISGDLAKPRRHFRLSNPADLSASDAAALYVILKDVLRAGYMRSGHTVGQKYQNWQRYNTAPYLSVTHGNHYLNNYANPVADAYGKFEKAGEFPVGSVVAKDSFTAVESGEIVLGPLFVMEKMPAGFNYVSGDWKYAMIMPSGDIFGETNGENSERVEYCIGCHLAVEQQDHLFFVPRTYRVAPDE